MSSEGTPSGKTARWYVELYLEVPATGADFDHEAGVDSLVWEMRKLLQASRGVWFEYEHKNREIVDDA